MKKLWNKLPLLGKIVTGIITGITFGVLLGHVFGANAFIVDGVLNGSGSWAVTVLRWIETIGYLVGQLLRFCIPIILVGFIAAGIAKLGQQAGRMLGISVGYAYISTILAGIFAFFVGGNVLTKVLSVSNTVTPNIPSIAKIFTINIDPIFGSITALVLAFVVGLVAAKKENGALYNILMDINELATFCIEKIVIPLLPLSIFTVFVGLSFSNGIIDLLKVFGMVYLIIIALHWVMIITHHTISAVKAKRNPFTQIRKMLPAYFTAIGTQSSAVTMPVTVKCAKEVGVDSDVTDFVVPLAANVHMPGSMITITMCSMAVAILSGTGVITIGQYLPFAFTLGLAMVAAPGVPGGAVMVAAGFLGSMLGFSESMMALMIGLYLAQDSFGTAGNVMTDSSIASLVEGTIKKHKK